MKTFRIKADFTFRAKDIADALTKLSLHFRMAAAGPGKSMLNTGGTCTVEPEPPKDVANDQAKT